ncbi:MAG: helix-hairpin-helix domain-containing protein, partial [Flavobacteriaceae bacterium]|nr:helix-hairpin-helix domain-containing protein [Flavobacteriaceae bacterium]
MLLLIILIQGIRYFLLTTPPKAPAFTLNENPSAIRWVDSLKTAADKDLPFYKYNPNYLSDYQGYLLGMSPEEIDRIFAYRAQGN